MDLYVISINDILDELMSENKRLLNELLFANNCLNELKTHLINIHSKYETTIDSEDKQKWDQLSDNTSGGLAYQELLKRLDLNTNGWQYLNRLCNEDIDVGRQYRCPFKHCNKGFRRKYHLMRHSLIHPKSSPMSPSSDRQFSQKRRLKRKTHTFGRKVLKDNLKTVGPFVCPIIDCQKRFKRNYPFILHLQSHKSIKCRVSGCDDRFSTDYDRHLHQMSVHNNTNTQDMDVCNDEVVNPKANEESGEDCVKLDETLDSYHKTQSSEDRFVCDINGCQKSFKRSFNLKLHIKRHHLFKCSINRCKDSFKTKTDLTSHQTSVHNITNIVDKTRVPKDPMSEYLLNNPLERDKCYDLSAKLYKCPIDGCVRSYETDVLFRKHLGLQHRLRQFRCEFKDCDKAFKNLPKLKEHSLIHSDIKPFKCHYNDCHFETHTQHILKYHYNTHSTDKPFVCDFTGCVKSYKHKISLDAHALMHTSGFKCIVCDQTFPSVARMDTHRRTHSSEPTFKCGRGDCPDMFYTKFERRKHLTVAHNLKPLVKKTYKRRCEWPGCDWMGKDLPAHKRIHTGEKPFACQWPDCGKQFRKKDGLNDHMNIHNNVKPHACHWPGCQYRATNTANVIKHRKQVHKT